MSELQTGKAILWGITNSGSAITIEGIASFILEGVKGNHKSQIDDVKDETGFDVSLIATNPFMELDVTFTPSGASRAAAAATCTVMDALTKVTLSNFKLEAFNGDWVYMGEQSWDLSHKQAKAMLKLRKYDDAAQNASLTTTVTD